LKNFVTPRQALRVGAPAEIVWFGSRTGGSGADEGVCPTPEGGPQYCSEMDVAVDGRRSEILNLAHLGCIPNQVQAYAKARSTRLVKNTRAA